MVDLKLSIVCGRCSSPSVSQVAKPNKPKKAPEPRKGHISYYNLSSCFCVAKTLKLGIQCKEDDACQKSNDSNGNPIVTCIVVLIKNALSMKWIMTPIRNATKNDNCKHLRIKLYASYTSFLKTLLKQVN